jgi:hypothetical protein
MRIASLALLTLLAGALPAGATLDQSQVCDSPPCSQEEIAAYERRAAQKMLRVQARRFEARGDQRRWEQLDRSFRRNQRRWIDAREALDSRSH